MTKNPATQHPKHANVPAYEQGTDYADVADGLIEDVKALLGGSHAQ